MNHQNKYVVVCLLAIATFLSAASFQPASAQSTPSLGAASSFSVLGGQAVTCTNSVITGDVGVSPTPAFANAGCTIAGNTPPATDVAAALARTAFLSTYNALGLMPCGQTFVNCCLYGQCAGAWAARAGCLLFPRGGDVYRHNVDARWVHQSERDLGFQSRGSPHGQWIPRSPGQRRTGV